MSTFKSDLATLSAHVAAQSPDSVKEVTEKYYSGLASSAPEGQALGVGDQLPRFALPNAKGLTTNPMSQLDKEFLVITFYRGQWCPFCNLQLRSMNRMLQSFDRVPAALVAISPVTPDDSLTMVEKNNLEFEVLSDVGNVVGHKFGVVYEIPDYLKKVYLDNDIDLQKYAGDAKVEIPLPSVFIANREGEILYRHVGKHPNDREDPNDILAFLQSRVGG